MKTYFQEMDGEPLFLFRAPDHAAAEKLVAERVASGFWIYSLAENHTARRATIEEQAKWREFSVDLDLLAEKHREYVKEKGHRDHLYIGDHDPDAAVYPLFELKDLQRRYQEK